VVPGAVSRPGTEPVSPAHLQPGGPAVPEQVGPGYPGGGDVADGANQQDGELLPERASAAQAKLDQIKDLYVTAEAIGEDALARHFEQLSQMQRSLIREYFHQASLARGADSATSQDGWPDDRASGDATEPGR
jgi:hypothetical protein